MLKNKNIILAIKPVYSYGLYRRGFLERLVRHSVITVNETFSKREALIFKFYMKIVMENLEMDFAVKTVNMQVKKVLQTYQGLRLHLNLPVGGQRTGTNASTQRMLAHIPGRGHFVQRRNRRKFAVNKDQKGFQHRNKNKDKTDEK